jgi:NAD(P)-dependent dehydrogenase (short-subunit alcohol dehydrogenase family)
MRKEEKLAFITGANRGIGWQTARELGELGIHVVLGCRDLPKGKRAAEALRHRGLIAEAILFDSTQPSTFQTAYAYLEEHYGKLDILINNAGIHPGDPANNRATTISSKLLREIFETNFISVVALTQVLLPLIKKSSRGTIVNISSIVGSLTLQSTPGSSIEDAKDLGYNASKTALNAFTIHLAHELRHTPIKVYSADPGWVKTDMGGSRALLEISEGGKSSAHVATLGGDAPSGSFLRSSETLPW